MQWNLFLRIVQISQKSRSFRFTLLSISILWTADAEDKGDLAESGMAQNTP